MGVSAKAEHSEQRFDRLAQEIRPCEVISEILAKLMPTIANLNRQFQPVVNA